MFLNVTVDVDVRDAACRFLNQIRDYDAVRIGTAGKDISGFFGGIEKWFGSYWWIIVAVIVAIAIIALVIVVR